MKDKRKSGRNKLVYDKGSGKIVNVTKNGVTPFIDIDEGVNMFEKVGTKEIRDIKGRLESELGDKNLPFQRKEEVKSLIYYLNTWLDWRDYQEREHYREVIKSES